MTGNRQSPDTNDFIDIFVSYAREDVEFAAKLFEFLKRRGFRVWWDNRLRPGEVYRVQIRDALESARCVVVLWSSSSRASEWVLDEAENAKTHGVLVPARIEDTQIPLGFGQRHVANLVDWDLESDSLEIEKLLKQIRFFTELGPRIGRGTSTPRELAARSEIGRRISAPQVRRQGQLNWTQRITSGFIGGAIGGIIAGLIIGLVYFFKYRGIDPRVSAFLLVETTAFASVYGGVMGAAVMYATAYSRELAKGKVGVVWGLSRLLGGPIGGMIAGAIVGVMAGVFFGFRYQYFPGAVVLLVSSLAGAAVLVFGAVYLEPGRTWPKMFWSATSSLIIAAVVAGIGSFVVLHLGIGNLFPGWKMTETDMARAGAITGGIIGIIIGCHVQWALYLISVATSPPK